MKVAIPVFDHIVPTSVTGPHDILSKTSLIHGQLTGRSKPMFDVRIIPFSKKAGKSFPYQAASDKKNEVYDLVVIPAMFGEEIPTVLGSSSHLINWLKWQHEEGAELSSICMGAFLLAATGLLDGKRATTHWMGAEQFRKMYPKVNLEDEKVIIDEGGIYTCAGAFSFTALMMYFVEKFCGHETAAMASKVFLVDLHKHSQNSYAIFSLQKNHGEQQILQVQEYIEKNFRKKLMLNELADKACMSLRTFLRKFKKATGNTPLEYIQRVRVESAKKLLEQTEKTVEQISLGVGYEDFSTFRTLFKRLTGSSPLDYRKRFRKINVSI